MANISKKGIPVVTTIEVDDLLEKRLPFVLRGANIGACSEKWNPEYLSEALGKAEVKIHVSESQHLDFLKKNFLYKTLLFEKLLQRASRSKQEDGEYFISPTECYYLRSVGKDPRKDVADIRQQFPAVAEDIIFPDFVPEGNVFS
ncbi:tRNA wybutosine-synthesizing protein 5, partial [Araneus ventricosus]